MRYLKQKSIKLQIMSLFLMFIIVIVLTMMITYQHSKKALYDKNEDYSIELLDKVTQYLDSRTDSISSIIKNTIYNADVQRYLMSEHILDKFELFQKVDGQVTTISQMESGIIDFTLVGLNGNSLNLMSNLQKRQAVHEMIAELKQVDSERSNGYLAAYKGIELKGKEQPFFIIGASIENVFPVETIGHMTMILDLNAIFPKFNTMLASGFGDFYVVDRHGIICASNNTALVGQRLELDEFTAAENDSYIIRTMELPDIDGAVVNIYSKQELFRGLNQVKTLYYWILALFIPFMLLLFWILSRNIVNPIRIFLRFIQSNQAKGMYQNPLRLELTGYYEIKVMADKFNEMLNRIDHLTEEVVTSETRIMALEFMKKQAELAYLKQQVNPHFLYNTLESLKGLAGQIGAKELRDKIYALGKMLRYSIKGKEEVTLQEELAIVHSYLLLQQFRFDDRFAVQMTIPPELLDCTVIKMILQPILENAITHGLEMRMEQGLLQIEAHINGENDIFVHIKDDGFGMDKHKLAAIRADLYENEHFLERNQEMEHLGIANVHHRLSTTYGEQYGVEIHSELNVGTEVILKFPRKDSITNV